MRLRRLSFVVGWTAVILLAVVGFAAFGTGPSQGNGALGEATGSEVGHVTGAYVGLGFVVLGQPEGTVPLSTAIITDSDLLSLASSGTTGSGEELAASLPEIDSSEWLSQVQVRALVSEYFSREDVNRAVRVAWCESRFDPQSVDLSTGAVGIFKHLPRYWADRASAAGFPGAEPSDPRASIAAAAWEVYEGGGWDVFSCRN